ncbi:hypothetical protein ACVXG7_29345 [Enterobacter hormaechei]
MRGKKAERAQRNGIQQSRGGRQPEGKTTILLMRSFFFNLISKEYLRFELCLNAQANKAMSLADQDIV